MMMLKAGLAVGLVIAGIVGLTGSQDDAFVYLPIQTAQQSALAGARRTHHQQKLAVGHAEVNGA